MKIKNLAGFTFCFFACVTALGQFSWANAPINSLPLNNRAVAKEVIRPGFEGPKNPPSFLATYILRGEETSESIRLKKTDTLTCTDDKIFYEWVKGIQFNSLKDGSRSIWAYATLLDCRENGDYVIFRPFAHFWALSEEGNAKLNEYVQRVSGAPWNGIKFEFSKPRNEIIRHLVTHLDSGGKVFHVASYFEEIPVGSSYQNALTHNQRFDQLMTDETPSDAIEKYFNSKVIDTKALDSLMEAARSTGIITQFFDVYYEFEAYPDSSVTLYGPFAPGYYSSEYYCNQPSVCKKSSSVLRQFKSPPPHRTRVF